jgi:hypothetical protein
MFGPIIKGLGLASTPAGRKMIRKAYKFARSEEGKKVIAHARKVAQSPEARKFASQAAKTAKYVGAAAKKPENQERVKAAAKVLRERGRRR